MLASQNCRDCNSVIIKLKSFVITEQYSYYSLNRYFVNISFVWLDTVLNTRGPDIDPTWILYCGGQIKSKCKYVRYVGTEMRYEGNKQGIGLQKNW